MRKITEILKRSYGESVAESQILPLNSLNPITQTGIEDHIFKFHISDKNNLTSQP